LSVLFGADAKVTDIQVVRGLPYGLTEKAVEAAKRIKFKPAEKDGKAVDVRGNVEFTFNLY
jgi:TonB family protein